MVTINWSNEAVIWLKEIHNYIALDNLAVAKKTIQGIKAKTKLLKNQPEIGYQYSTVLGRDIRILLYGHYRIAYLIKNSNNIDILGVFHGALNIDKYLV